MPTTPPTTAAPRPARHRARPLRVIAGVTIGLGSLTALLLFVARDTPLTTWWNARAAIAVTGMTIAGTLAAVGLRGVRCGVRYAVGRRHDAEATADLHDFAPRRVLHLIAVLALLAGTLVAVVETVVVLTNLTDPARLGAAIATQLLAITYGAALAVACVITAARMPHLTEPSSPALARRSPLLIAAAATTVTAAAALVIIAAVVRA